MSKSSKAKLKRQELISEIANYIAREPSLDAHGDHLCDVAYAHFEHRLEGDEFNRAVLRLLRTLREMVALDALETQFTYIPPEPRKPRRQRRAIDERQPGKQMRFEL